MDEYITDSSNPNVIIETYGNTQDKYKILKLGISYSFNHPVFNSMTSLNYSKSDLRIPFRNEIMVFNKPAYSFKTSGNIKILKNTNLGYLFYYMSLRDSDNVRRKAYGNSSVTISQHLMNRKLMIVLSVRDIFKQSKSMGYTYYSNNVASENYLLLPDSRYVSITVRYNWGVNKNIQKKKSDTDHIGRIDN
jgi:hypothetical protein